MPLLKVLFRSFPIKPFLFERPSILRPLPVHPVRVFQNFLMRRTRCCRKKQSAKELLYIITSAEQQVNIAQHFRATDLAPKAWEKSVYEPIFRAADGDRATALRLFGVIIKQALIMSPLLFSQESAGEWEAATYFKETLKF